MERVLGQGAIVERMISGKELVGLRYQPLYPRIDTMAYPEAYQALDAAFVSFEDGTGIVHIAPAYGEEDFAFKRRGIPPIFTVHQNGTVMEGYPGAGKFFKAADADVRADLTRRGLLFRDETIRHTYPFCWRCDTPLLAYARASWYITMSKLRVEIQERNQTIHWLPEHIRDGRFGEWLRELKDWAITRERYWGAPMPIWECDRCQHREVLGSFVELIERVSKRNRFILMRHGEARSNVEHRINSKLETSPQYPLTEAGRARVAAAAEQLKQAGITTIIASPFHRMRQTAEIVSAIVGVPVTYDDRLREIDLPDFDGKPETEFNGRFASAFEKFGIKIGANETWNELARRMLLALKDIDARHEGEVILICSHGDPLFLLRWAFSGRTKEGIDRMPYPTFDDPEAFSFIGALVNDRGELDVHRPFIDTVSWSCAKDGCGGAMKRFLEVVDVWLESGCMPFAQVHYPFEQENGISPPKADPPLAENLKSQISNPPALYPADYISEAIDQTRGWFYTLLAVATVLGWEAPYRNVIVLGHLLDKDGQKMSKSKGNVVNPIAMIDRYGADVVRWYMVSVNQPWDAKLFNEEDLKLMSRKPFGTLMNLLSFWELHGGETQPRWPEARGETSGVDRKTPDVEERAGFLLDSWLRARTRQAYDAVTQHLDAYELTEAARAISDLVDDCSTWWLQRSRERLKLGDVDARATFSATLRSLSIFLAPLAPFYAEHLWQTLHQDGSVHLVSWDVAAPPALVDNDAALFHQMAEVRRLCSLGLQKRAEAGIPVRQPLAGLTIRGGLFGGAYQSIVMDAVQVQALAFDSSIAEDVSLDPSITPQLREQGLIHALARHIQGLRKQLGFRPHEQIRIRYTADDAMADVIRKHEGYLAVRTNSLAKWNRVVDTELPHAVAVGDSSVTLDIAPEPR